MADQQTNIDRFNNSLVEFFQEKWHPDVRFLAGNDDQENPIPAHKVIMAARSDYLKELINDGDSDDEKPIILYGMNHEALEVFIEFMYIGSSIHSEKLKKHARSLYVAAELYQISLLRELCRHQLMFSLNISNALDILELSKDDPHEKTLHDMARCYVIDHMKGIAFTDEFNSFVERNPSLTVELIKASFVKGERRRQNIGSLQTL